MRLGYEKTYFEYQSSTQKSSNHESLSGGIFARKFFLISEKFLFALDGSASYGRNTYTYLFNNNVAPDYEIKVIMLLLK